MTEFKADILRRKISSIPLIKSPVKKYQVSTEAPDVKSALYQIFEAELLEYPSSRFQVCVQIREGSKIHVIGVTELRRHP